MSRTTSVHDYLSNLADLLAARDDLAGVEITTAGMDKLSKPESIQFISVNQTSQPLTVGRGAENRRRTENYTVRGIIWIKKPGANETAIRAARQRAIELLAQVERQILTDATADGAALKSDLTAYALDQGITDTGRWCQIDFTLAVEATLA